jgi:hypothetical protein
MNMSSLRNVAFTALVVFAVAQAGAASGASGKTADGKPDMGGVWLVEKPQKEVKTTAGKAPPLKPEAAALYAKRKQAVASGKDAEDPLALCLPHGVPRLLNAPRPIHILQKPKQITVLYEANHQARMFYMDEAVPSADNMPDPTFDGFSVARWAGNTLVVDTVAMNDQTWLDDVGLPHSDALKVVERYELDGADRLRVNITVTDPETFTAPWEMQVTYKKQPGLRFKEDACSEKFWHPGKANSG